MKELHSRKIVASILEKFLSYNPYVMSIYTYNLINPHLIVVPIIIPVL